MNRVAIIGGGASGIMAAISAAKNGARVTIYEKNDRVGKKILATGNGRCNLTNIYADVDNYYSEDKTIISKIIDKYWVSDSLDFFNEIGLLYKVEDEGKVYPYSNHASSVLDVLRFQLDKLKVETVFDFEVKEVMKTKDGFRLISYKSEVAMADAIIVTTGGKASPASGSNGSGYQILEGFGHSVTRLFPSLVQIRLKPCQLTKLNGIKIDATCTAYLENGEKVQKSGEILFTDYGISGPCAFSISRIAGEMKECKFFVDLMPEYSEKDLLEILRKHREIMRVSDELFVGILNKRIGQAIIKSVLDIKMNDDIKKITDDDLKKIANKVKFYEVVSEGTMSWNNAQVTAGGVRLKEFDQETLESKLCPGVFAAGEVLDVDGDCGGFNLQWAWSSGYLAGFYASSKG